MEVFGHALVDQLDPWSLGLKLVRVAGTDEWSFRDTNHMMGGARFGASAAEGVVDQRSALHDAPDVLVLGASSFPTGGVANPTMTAAAFALRAARDAWEAR